MFKKIAVAFLLLLVVAVVGTVFYIDRVVKAAVERGSTYALGTETTLDSASVGLFSGEAELSGLQIENPPEFDSTGLEPPHFFHLERGFFSVSLPTLMKEKIVSPRLELEGVEISLQKRGGKGNYEIILENLKRFEGEKKPDEKPEEPAPEEGPQKKFMIDEVVIENVTVHANILPVGGDLVTVPPIRIPEIRLKDVGTESDKGVLLSELAGIIITAILQAVVESGVELPVEILEELGSGLAEITALAAGAVEVIGNVTGGVSDTVEQAGDAVKEQLKKAKEALGEAPEELGEGVEEATKGVEKGVDRIRKGIEGLGQELEKIGERGEEAVEDASESIRGETEKSEKKKEPAPEEEPPE